LSVIFHNADLTFNLKEKRAFRKWISNEINESGLITGTINIIFCSDEYLLEINKKYLNHDYFTDIVTFNYNEKNIISGDLFISVDRIRENAENFETEFSNELARVLIHGILHLLGYEDYSPELKKIIHEREDEALKRLSL